MQALGLLASRATAAPSQPAEAALHAAVRVAAGEVLGSELAQPEPGAALVQVSIPRGPALIPVNAVVRKTITERQVHFQSSECFACTNKCTAKCRPS